MAKKSAKVKSAKRTEAIDGLLTKHVSVKSPYQSVVAAIARTQLDLNTQAPLCALEVVLPQGILGHGSSRGTQGLKEPIGLYISKEFENTNSAVLFGIGSVARILNTGKVEQNRSYNFTAGYSCFVGVVNIGTIMQRGKFNLDIGIGGIVGVLNKGDIKTAGPTIFVGLGQGAGFLNAGSMKFTDGASGTIGAGVVTGILNLGIIKTGEQGDVVAGISGGVGIVNGLSPVLATALGITYVSLPTAGMSTGSGDDVVAGSGLYNLARFLGSQSPVAVGTDNFATKTTLLSMLSPGLISDLKQKTEFNLASLFRPDTYLPCLAGMWSSTVSFASPGPTVPVNNAMDATYGIINSGSIDLGTGNDVMFGAADDINRKKPEFLSAFWGLDNGAPTATPMDGMPITFSWLIDPASIDPTDFKVIRSDGTFTVPTGATLLPANESNETQTILLFGDFGETASAVRPVRVQLVGELVGHPPNSTRSESFSDLISPPILPLEAGPYIVDAWRINPDLLTNDPNASKLGSTFIRVVWAAGITDYPTGTEVGVDVTRAYRLTYLYQGKIVTLTPLDIGDLNDGDNMHDLSFSEIPAEAKLLSITLPGGYVEDPNGDPNLAQIFRFKSLFSDISILLPQEKDLNSDGYSCAESAYGMQPLDHISGFSGLDAAGTGIWNSDTGTILLGDGNDTIRGETWAVSAPADPLSPAAGIINLGTIQAGEGNDLISGYSGTSLATNIGILNNGLIQTGAGDDTVDALAGGFSGSGLTILGEGNDTLIGFGTGRFDGGGGIGANQKDTLLLGNGTYVCSLSSSPGGFFSLSQENPVTYNSATMLLQGFERIGAASDPGTAIDFIAGQTYNVIGGVILV